MSAASLARAEQGAAHGGGYRADIDGLRAVAVMAVILNHLDHSFLPSGYLGVDIFFVISGFVISASLSRNTHNNLGLFLLGFYARRVRRILPALITMVVISALAICLVDPNPGTSLLTGIGAIFGVSNIYLVARLTDYFAASTDLNVFLHTWSLGVEEQFYFFFPILAWWSSLGGRRQAGSRRMLLALTPLLLASLLAFVFLIPLIDRKPIF